MRRCVYGAAAVVWLVLSATAEAWTPAVTVSPPGELQHEAAVALGGDGRAAVAWSRSVSGYESHVKVRLRDPAANDWRPVQLASPNRAGQNEDPAIAVDADGNALLIWTWGGNTILSAYAPAGEDFEPATTVATDPTGTGAQYPFVAFDAHGEALAIWFEQDYRVHYAVRPPGGEFGADRTVPRAPEVTWATSEAVAANGAAAVTWADTQVWLSRRPPGGAFGAPQSLGAIGLAAGPPHLGVDPQGDVTVAWAEQVDAHTYMRATTIRADGTVLAPTTTLAEVSSFDFQAAVTMNPAGDATIAWAGDSIVPDVYAGIVAVTRPAGGPFGAPQAITPAELGTDDLPALTYDASDTTRVLWRHYDDNDSTHVRIRMLAQDRPHAGRFRTEPATIGATEDITTPVVLATGPSGSALAAWTYGDFGLGPLQVTFDDPAGRRRLRHAGCALGSVRHAASRRRSGRVLRQRPAAGAWRPHGARVAVVLAT